MAWPAALVILPFGIVFFVSGLIVNLIQALLFIFVRPVSKSLYRRLNKIVAESLWLELIWLVDWWSGLKIELYADDRTFELMGKEHALLICNHRSDIDWLVGWVLAQRSGCLGSALAVMKKEAKALPIIGWSMWFSDYLFLKRSWDKDERTLKSGFERLKDFPMPFWLALFVEGTRFTQAKLQAAQEFATSRGLPFPRNVLIPRSKGFVSAVTHLRSFVPAIYDGTVAVANNQPAPTLLRMLSRQSSVIRVQIKRHSMQELPETADGIAQWCKDIFVTKDAMLEKYFDKDLYSDQKLQDIGRPKKSMFVVIFWLGLLLCAALQLFQLLSSLASWEVITFSVIFLVLVIVILQVLILSSKSELSPLPTNVTISGETRESLLPE